MLKQIQYFQAVVKYKSFSRAAEECYISQSAISQQVQALEKELGVVLLNRKNRQFSLTPAGEHFYRRSLLLTADYETLCKETRRIASGDNASLSIGYLKCYSGREFQMAVADFSEKFPDVEVHVVTGNHEDLYHRLRSGSVDLILSDQRRAFSDEYVNFILVTTPCTIEIAPRNPIAAKEAIETTELKDTPCILVSSEEQRENEEAYYREIVGIPGDIIFAESLEEARMMVVSGKGYLPVEGVGADPAPGANTVYTAARRT